MPDPAAKMTVSRLIELLSQCPGDRPVYVLDDSMEYPVNVVMPEFDIWQKGTVVMISAGDA